MSQRIRPYDEPGQQLFWKITLTSLCVIVGAIAAICLFRLQCASAKLESPWE